MSEQNDYNLITGKVDFKSIHVPLPTEGTFQYDDSYVKWGRDNLYPNYLISLLDCSIHSDIIKQKTSYIVSDGLYFEDGSEIGMNYFNKEDSPYEFIEKLAMQYVMFNAFAIEVCYNILKEPIEYHVVPINYLRMNKSKSKFWYCDSWQSYQKNEIIYDKWSVTPNNTTSKIFYVDGSSIALNKVYPTPEYSGGITSIATSIAINDFNLNNIKSNFSLATLVTVYGGKPTEEAIYKVRRELEEVYSGENGKKFLLQFKTDEKTKTTFDNLQSDNWIDAYNTISEKAQQDIYKSHQINAKVLYGEEIAGKLGTGNEMPEAYKIHKANYIAGKRKQITSALFKLTGQQFAFKESQAYNPVYSDNVLMAVLTIDEIRADMGREPMANGAGKITPAVAQAQAKPATPETTQPIQQPIEQTEVKKNSRSLTEEDFESVKHLGEVKGLFDLFNERDTFSKESDVSDYLISQDISNLTVDELIDLIKKDLGIDVTANELDSYMNNLKNAGVINIDDSDGTINIKTLPAPVLPETDQITVVYDYRKREEASGSPIISTTRSFCRKILESDRYYTRQDIQDMSAIFGFDVFTHCGGWWFDSETQTTNTHCRHFWKPIQVKRKPQ